MFLGRGSQAGRMISKKGPPSEYQSGPKAARKFAEQIIRCRKTLGLSEAQLARWLNVDPGILARWEIGKRKLKETG